MRGNTVAKNDVRLESSVQNGAAVFFFFFG